MFSGWNLLIILLIVLLLFGAKRLRNVGSDLGAAVKGFRKAVKDGEEGEDGEKKVAGKDKEGRVIEGEVSKEKDKV